MRNKFGGSCSREEIGSLMFRMRKSMLFFTQFVFDQRWCSTCEIPRIGEAVASENFACENLFSSGENRFALVIKIRERSNVFNRFFHPRTHEQISFLIDRIPHRVGQYRMNRNPHRSAQNADAGQRECQLIDVQPAVNGATRYPVVQRERFNGPSFCFDHCA